MKKTNLTVVTGLVGIITGLLVGMSVWSSRQPEVVPVPIAWVSPAPTQAKPSGYPQYTGQVILHGSRNERKVALTFDADMTPGMRKKLISRKVESYYDKKVIQVLHEKQVSATLFVAGMWGEYYSQELKALAADPLFEIGNHSYSHPAFTKKCFNLPGVKNREYEFSKSQEVLTKLSGYKPVLFRFPGGCYSQSDVTMANKYGLTVVHWDVDGRDAFGKSKAEIVKAVEKGAQNGSIVVMHMVGDKNSPYTAAALPEVIDYLRGNGYSLVKVSELLK